MQSSHGMTTAFLGLFHIRSALRSGDKIFVQLDNEVTDRYDPAWRENTFPVVGWGVRPALGLTLMFVITRLLVFKRRVMEKFYHPSGKWLQASSASFEFID